MLNAFIKFIADKLVNWCDRTGRTHYIKGDGEETTYLVRYIVLKSKYLTIFIHRFMRSDAGHPHDHPWNFLTYIISGSYTEHFYDRAKPKPKAWLQKQVNGKAVQSGVVFGEYWTETLNVRTAGSIAYRRANDIHQVECDKELTLDEIQDAPYTVCFIGPRIREWGFWVDDVTFKDWREYLNIRNSNDPRIEGSK